MIEINSKYGKYLGNDLEPTATCISATVNEQGLIGNFVVDIDGKYLHYENNDLTEIVKDKLYETLFPNRAEKEAITNINTEIEKIKTELLTDLETKINEKLEKSQTELTSLVMTLMAEAIERDEEVEEETEEEE